MTFQKFFDTLWCAKHHHALIFRADDFNDVWDWALENEDGLWKDIPADAIVAIDTHHTGWQAEWFLSERWLNAEVTGFIILSGCVCIFLDEQIGNPDRLEDGESE